MRDVKRLVRVPKAWIIVLGIMIIPALYAWFNIRAFWDPYGNTGNIHVAVANIDRGASSDLTGDIDVGSQVVSQLKENDQLGWEFMDAHQAQQAVKSGDAYAAIIIPEDFSENLLSVTTGDFTQPKLQYYVNEKASPIAPKMTDTGATQLDQQITNTFKKQVAAAATDQLKDAGGSIELQLLTSKDSALSVLDKADEDLDKVQGDLGDLRGGITDAQGQLAGAQDTLADVDALLGDVHDSLSQAQSLMDEAQQQIIDFADQATTAYTDGIGQLADASSKANIAITQVTQGLETAGVRVDGAIDDITAVVDTNAQAISGLQSLLDESDLDTGLRDQLQNTIDTLTIRNQTDQQLLADLKNLKSSTSDAVDSVQGVSDSLDDALQGSKDSASDLQSALSDNVPQLNSAMSQLSTSAGELSGAIDTNKAALEQAGDLLTDLDGQLDTTLTALDSLDGNLEDTKQSVQDAKTDIAALAAADQWGELSTITGLDSQQIASFISSPIELNQHVVFAVNSYGSAMAALFTNLSLWIGAFMLMVMFKLEVDTEDAVGVTVRQAYLARFGLLALVALGQALVVSIGDLILGVQTVNPFAFVGTSVLIGFAYLSVVYSLSVAFGHVGRGLCVVLMIMQIPGASGLYPIEVMPGFFRAIYPLLPFSYGISALRETIGGFYGNHYWQYMGTLAVFVFLAFLLGLVVRRRLGNFHVLVNRQITSTDLFTAENVEVTGGGLNLAGVIAALTKRRGHFAARNARFARRYPMILRAIVGVGLGGVLIFGAVAARVTGAKALVLGLFTLWCLIIMGALIALEYVKESFAVVVNQEESRVPVGAHHVILDDDEALVPAAPEKSGAQKAADPTDKSDSTEPGEERPDEPEPEPAGKADGDDVAEAADAPDKTEAPDGTDGEGQQ